MKHPLDKDRSAPRHRFSLVVLASVLVAGCGEGDASYGQVSATLDVPASVRVATWNVQTVGTPGSTQYEAALSVLMRIDADVVGINEVDGSGDTNYLLALAAEANYPYTHVPSWNPFGSLKNAVISRFPFVGEPLIHTSESLSGDPTANDLTRWILEAGIDVPDNSNDLTLVTEHWKSGVANADEFRRATESIRIAQVVADLDPMIDCYVVVGDVNEEIDEVPRPPDPFTYTPTGMPWGFEVGDDIQAEMDGPGLRNNPYYYLEPPAGPDLVVLEARQLDGRDGTRPASGRRLDYIFVSRAVATLGPSSEVYDSADEGMSGGLPKHGGALPASTCLDASDHLPVFADITIAAGSCLIDSDCADPVFCNGVETCLGGACQPGTPVDCDDGIGCTTDACNETADQCDHIPVHAQCDNGHYCDGTETCDPALGCRSGTDIDCDDGISCTTDSCDEAADRCDHAPADSLCDNGQFCDGVESCDPAFGCRQGTAVACSDGVPCTADSCNEATDGCDHLPVDALCDNGQYCDGAESCDPAQGCRAGVSIACDDGIGCTHDACDEAADACGHQPVDSLCDNQLFCDGVEICDADAGCLSGQGPCEGLACDETQDECVTCLSDAACDNGQSCDGEERCVGGECVPGTPIDCDDGIDCTVDSCDQATGVCDHQPVDASCDNGSFCDGAETCDPAFGCRAGPPEECDDVIACTTDSCNEATDGCDHLPVDSQCDNGQFCDGAEICDPDQGCSLGPYPCPGQACDEALDACGDCQTDEDCNDHRACNGVERCADGSCLNGTPVDCDDGDACTVDTCDQATGACDNETVDCDDGVACTEDSCDPATGSCAHEAVDARCDDDTFCNGEETCDPASGCVRGADPCPGLACDEALQVCGDCQTDADCADDSVCNGEERCVDFACLKGAPVDCDNGVACTADRCNEAGGCDHVPDDSLCDNGQFCDGAETCDPHRGCTAGAPPDCSEIDTACHQTACDEAADRCVADPLPDGTPCQGADACIERSTCQAGVCTGGKDACATGCGCQGFGGGTAPWGFIVLLVLLAARGSLRRARGSS